MSQATEQVNAAEFDARVDDTFARIASRYDLLCDLFSLCIHRYWKRRVARVIAAEPWTRLLDAACGTGDIVIRVLARQNTSGRHIIASDACPEMLAIAARRLPRIPQVDIRQLDAESMPSINDASVDLFSISLGLKICNRRAVLAEAWRVLRPGGRLVVLEASNIPIGWINRAYLLYMAVCMPIIGWIATGGDASAYRYLLHGIRGFPTAEALASEIRDFGFVNARFERLSLGIIAIHCARKPTVLDA